MTIKDVLYGVSKGLPAVIPNNYVANFVGLNPNTAYSTPTCASKNIEVDIDDNVIVYTGLAADSANTNFFSLYSVYDKTGKKLTQGSSPYNYATKRAFYSIKKSAIDGSYYVFGSKTNTYQPLYIGKYASTGDWLWGYRIDESKQYDGAWNNPYSFQPKMTIDSSDNCYIVGSAELGYFRFTKITPNGVVSWSKKGQQSGWYTVGMQMMPNGNICMVGRTGVESYILIMDTSGTIITSVRYSAPNYPSNYHYPHTLCIDVNNNIYVGFNRVSNTGTFGLKLVKFNSSGVFQWGKEIIEYLPGYGAYVAVNPNPPYDCYITGINGNTYAFSSSGTLLWKRTMGGGDHPTGIGVDSKEGLILQQGFFIGRFPTDGTKTGTYAVPGGGNFTWSVGSQTVTDITSFPAVTSDLTLIAANFSLTDVDWSTPGSPYTYPTPQNSKTVF